MAEGGQDSAPSIAEGVAMRWALSSGGQDGEPFGEAVGRCHEPPRSSHASLVAKGRGTVSSSAVFGHLVLALIEAILLPKVAPDAPSKTATTGWPSQGWIASPVARSILMHPHRRSRHRAAVEFGRGDAGPRLCGGIRAPRAACRASPYVVGNWTERGRLGSSLAAGECDLKWWCGLIARSKILLLKKVTHTFRAH